MAHLSAIAFAVRQALLAKGTAPSIGHVQQLVAAALGHNNLASYQASNDEAGLPLSADIVLAASLLESRAEHLGHGAIDLLGPLKDALKQRFVDAEIYDDHESWLIEVQEYFELALVRDDNVSSEVAMTNGTFPRAHVDLEWWDSLDQFDGEDLTMRFGGRVIVDQDEDKVYWGDEIRVSADLGIERFGRRLFGQRWCHVERAQLNWLGESPDESESLQPNL